MYVYVCVCTCETVNQKAISLVQCRGKRMSVDSLCVVVCLCQSGQSSSLARTCLLEWMDDALSIQFVSVISKRLENFGVVVAMLQRETSQCWRHLTCFCIFLTFCLASCFLPHNCLVSEDHASLETSNEPQLAPKDDVRFL